MATGKDREAPSLLSLRQEARTIYGSDARGYDAGRPAAGRTRRRDY